MNNEQIARRLFQCINERDMNGMTALTSDDCNFIDVPQGTTLSGRNAPREACETWLSAFPDGTVQVLNVVAGSDYAVVEYVGRGTHTGPLGRGADAVPPTNQRVELHFCDVLHIKDGKIAGVNSYYDLATLMRQLRLLEQPAAKRRPEARPH